MEKTIKRKNIYSCDAGETAPRIGGEEWLENLPMIEKICKEKISQYVKRNRSNRNHRA